MDDNTMLNRKFDKTKYNKYNLYFQIEHNLVLRGGRSIDHVIEGNVPSLFNDSEKYIVRIVNLFEYYKYDYIMEYSLPNIENIKLSNRFDKNFIDKILYLPPLVYDYEVNNQKRKIDILTTFMDTINQPRRNQFLDQISQQNMPHINVNSKHDKHELQKLYDDTKIIVNIHQTDHHHTLEEFRILPAITRGVVIISENVPLKQVVPYHEYIIWCNIENVFDTINDVYNNYTEYYDKFFGKDSQLKTIIQDLEDDAFNKIDEKLL